MKHWRYFCYVIKHKWYVFCECQKVGLTWRGLVHDASKLLPSEWFPYAEHFYGGRKKKWRDETGYYKPTDTGDSAFDFAWLLHQKRNRHHWQWWILPEDDGGTKVIEMERTDAMEMMCDWCGASRAQGYGGWGGVRLWYEKHKEDMVLHPSTRREVERRLSRLKEVT